MKTSEMPPGWWVPCNLPDGRTAIADAEDPGQACVVAAIRRISKAPRSKSHAGCPGGSRCREKCPGNSQDYAVVAAWLDGIEPLPDGQLFVMAPGSEAR